MNKSISAKLTGKKILFAALPAEGHFAPLTGLAKDLQAVGCDVRWYSSNPFSQRLEQLSIPYFPMKRVRDIMDPNDEFQLKRVKIDDPVERLNSDTIEGVINRGPEYLEDIKEIYQSFPFDAMIADNVFMGIPYVRHILKIPVISIGVIPLPEDSIDVAPYGTALPPAGNDEQRELYAKMLDGLVNGMFKESVDRLDDLLTHYDIPHHRAMMTDVIIKQADLHLQIGVPEFEYKRSDIGANIRFVGALTPWSSKTTQATWSDDRLKKYKKVILVTQGTIEKDATKLLIPVLQAYRNTDTLVIATTGGSKTQELRDGFSAKNVIIEDFIPFSAVMPHVNVFVTNGGYGGTLMSILNKVPLVAAGVHEGKNEICARIGHFKIGVNLQTETPTLQQLKEGVDMILNDDEYAKNITRLADSMQQYDSLNLCGEYIAELLTRKRALLAS